MIEFILTALFKHVKFFLRCGEPGLPIQLPKLINSFLFLVKA